MTKHIDVPQMQVVENIVEGPHLLIFEKTAETQTIQGTQTSESLGTAPVCQVTQAENVDLVEIGAPLLAESAPPIFVAAPAFENPPVVVESVQPALVAEFVGPAPEVMYGHDAHVVECVNSAPTVTHGASPVAHAA